MHWECFLSFCPLSYLAAPNVKYSRGECIMADRPDIKPGEWIQVGKRSCVVCNVRKHGHSFGDCEVVFNPEKPANADVEWSGKEWVFKASGDYGGYADKYSRFNECVQILKRGQC
jgi:hypothetical protein